MIETHRYPIFDWNNYFVKYQEWIQNSLVMCQKCCIRGFLLWQTTLLCLIAWMPIDLFRYLFQLISYQILGLYSHIYFFNLLSPEFCIQRRFLAKRHLSKSDSNLPVVSTSHVFGLGIFWVIPQLSIRRNQI